ncbi:Unknown protein sequence [Pseudomonas amygdali pv. myricae]|nr:Unknown protein sequence [Pseudomonas amygdali pv. myricae]
MVVLNLAREMLEMDIQPTLNSMRIINYRDPRHHFVDTWISIYIQPT